MTPMPLDTTAEPPVGNKIDLGLGGHKARDQPTWRWRRRHQSWCSPRPSCPRSTPPRASSGWRFIYLWNITKTSSRFLKESGTFHHHKSQDYSQVREKSGSTVAWPSRAQLTSVHRPRHNLLKLRRRQSEHNTCQSGVLTSAHQCSVVITSAN